MPHAQKVRTPVHRQREEPPDMLGERPVALLLQRRLPCGLTLWFILARHQLLHTAITIANLPRLIHARVQSLVRCG